MPYNLSNYDRLDPADKMKIERSVYYPSDSVDISHLTGLSVEQLQTMRGESAAAEQAIYDNLREAAGAWATQAGQTLLYDKAIEYARMPLVLHTANQWVTDSHNKDRRNMSNMVFKMSYYVYERTRYDRETQKSVPVAWELDWNVHTNAPHNRKIHRIAGQDKKSTPTKPLCRNILTGA